MQLLSLTDAQSLPTSSNCRDKAEAFFGFISWVISTSHWFFYLKKKKTNTQGLESLGSTVKSSEVNSVALSELDSCGHVQWCFLEVNPNSVGQSRVSQAMILFLKCTKYIDMKVCLLVWWHGPALTSYLELLWAIPADFTRYLAHIPCSPVKQAQTAHVLWIVHLTTPSLCAKPHCSLLWGFPRRQLASHTEHCTGKSKSRGSPFSMPGVKVETFSCTCGVISLVSVSCLPGMFLCLKQCC